MKNIVTKPIIEDFIPIRLADIRTAIGKRRFQAARRVTVVVNRGKSVPISFVKRPSNFGPHMNFMKCPRCGKPRRVLRIVVGNYDLLCFQCLKTSLGALYASQVRRKKH